MVQLAVYNKLSIKKFTLTDLLLQISQSTNFSVKMFLDSSLPKFPATATKVLCYVNRNVTSTGLSYMLHVLLNIYGSCIVTYEQHSEQA